jgi:methionyl-tRNA formyltransferase
MTRPSAILLMPPPFAERVREIANATGVALDTVTVTSLDEVRRAAAARPQWLISFANSVIVPESVLAQEGLTAINIHAASPKYPGRDPHHFAVFDGAAIYGATMHVMTRHVDAGPILDVETFAVDSAWPPVQLLQRANEAGFVLARRLFESIKRHGRPPAPNGVQWGSHTYTRKEFLALGRIDPSMPAGEVARRLRAVAMPGHRNAYLDVHGHRFRIEDGE